MLYHALQLSAAHPFRPLSALWTFFTIKPVILSVIGKLMVMARQSAVKEQQEPSSRQRDSRFLTSHLEPPSPEEPAKPGTLFVAADEAFSTCFARWPTWPSPLLTEPLSEHQGSEHVPIDASQCCILNIPVFDYVTGQSPENTHSTRQPRHAPIIIPDCTQAFSQNIGSVSSEFSIQVPSSTVRISLSDGCGRPLVTDGEANMNQTQVSLAASEASIDGATGSAPPAAAASNGHAGMSPIANPNPPAPAPTNPSGLVCNVYRTTGQEPHGLVGATTTILGDKLYVFGGRIHSRTKPQLTSDLYELDLIRRHWTKVDALGDIPPPRYFHSVCALGDSKLVCYGGMSTRPPKPVAAGGPGGAKANPEPQPEVMVMSDIHVFDVPTRTWTMISTSDDPQGRYAHCAAILPSSAVFTSAHAPLSAIHHNPPSSDPHSGTLGVQLDGTGGAEMVVVGGQDGVNNYIEQISVFNFRSLKWTAMTPWDRKCGAYKSMVAPMTGLSADLVGQGVSLNDAEAPRVASRPGTSMLIYSNYNFLDVKLELQIRFPDGTMVERAMTGPVSPPGLRFPNGGIVNNHFVVSGTYLTASKHEYALWALDLRTLTWTRIDTNGSIFSQGSWNRGILWHRRNTFVILGHKKRSLVDDYNHRRINFSHVCMLELEAFGLYDNPRRSAPTSGYVSVSSPSIPASLPSNLSGQSAGGRPYTSAAERLGQAALTIPELSDMEIVARWGERIPCNSFILSRRWGPYFHQLLFDSTSTHEYGSLSDAATLRPTMRSQASRNSSITITPSVANSGVASGPGASTDAILDPQRSLSRSTTRTLVEPPNTTSVPASSRSRSLYLPHMVQTIQLFLHFLYTSALPPIGSPLCTSHTLCSLLQLARPYQVDGLLEATVERLHEVLDGRNTAAVFNAAAMAAGGGRAYGGSAAGAGAGGPLDALGRRESETTTIGDPPSTQALAAKAAALKITTNFDNVAGNLKKGHGKTGSMDSTSTATSASASTDLSHTDTESSTQESNAEQSARKERETRDIWTGDVSSVIGLQKRALRGLMERRLRRERANTMGTE